MNRKRFQPEMPKIMVWVLTIPFMIVLFPLGFLYSLILLILDVKDGAGLKGFAKGCFWAMLKPGFYVGLAVVTVVSYATKIMNKLIRRKKIKSKL